ncbi:MAG: T9SS type A sorting domain-containing protein [Bacteroidales bacterium]|nr:T9SS type A sorting domain-containing protein [Bacteroidales bacterium]
MKTFLFALCFLCMAKSIISQNVWYKTYDFNGNTDLCFKAIETSLQNYILCGATTIPSIFSYGFDGIILSINQQGDTVWTKKLGSMDIGAQSDFLFDVIENNNHELVLAGIRKQGTQKQQLWIVKIQLNNNGTQILNVVEKQFGILNKDDGAAKIIQNSDGSYMVIGFTESYGTQSGGKDAWLLKLNQNLDTIWTTTFDFGYEDEGACIIPFNTNHYLIAINSNTGQITPFPGYTFYTSFAKLLLVDNLGNVIKTLTFNTDTINKISNIIKTSDGGAILVGSTSMYDNGSLGGRDIFIVKLNQQVDIEWIKTYGNFGKYDGGIDIKQAADNTFYLASYSQSQYTQYVDNWWLLRLNSNGDTLYTKWLNILPDNDDPSCLLFTSDGGILISGWINANSNPFQGLNMGNSDICLIKTDTTFNYTNIKESNYSTKLINIYPNPAVNRIFIDVQLPLNNLALSISDATGKSIFTVNQLSEKHIIIDRKIIPNEGIYFIHLQKNKAIIASEKIIISD